MNGGPSRVDRDCSHPVINNTIAKSSAGWLCICLTIESIYHLKINNIITEGVELNYTDSEHLGDKTPSIILARF